MSIDRSRLLSCLAAVPFQPGRWVVAGSAPMLMAGLVESIQDVDIVVDGPAWEMAVSLSDSEPHDGLFGDHMIELDMTGAPVEVFDGWLGIDASVLLAEAVEIEGFRFSPLARVLDSKRRLSRNKDLAHMELLEALLTDGPAANSQ